MSGDKLAKMANDIGHFFGADSNREDAVAGIAEHIGKFWTRRMREKLIAHLDLAEPGLEALPLEAVKRLAARAAQGRGSAH
jgi:formate dehydrogenase subunit delta